MLSRQGHSYTFIINICVVSLLLLFVFSYQYWTLPNEYVAKFGAYVQLLTVFILMVTGLITVLNFIYQQDDRKHTMSLHYANLNQNEINDIEKMFMSNPNLDRLYLEMYSHSPHVQKIANAHVPIIETPEILKTEHHMASIIFQRIADVYFCEQLDDHGVDVDNIEWFNTFYGWMKSPLLRSHWKTLKYEHHPDVQKFVDGFLINQNPYITRRSS